MRTVTSAVGGFGRRSRRRGRMAQAVMNVLPCHTGVAYAGEFTCLTPQTVRLLPSKPRPERIAESVLCC